MQVATTTKNAKDTRDKTAKCVDSGTSSHMVGVEIPASAQKQNGTSKTTRKPFVGGQQQQQQQPQRQQQQP